MIAESVAKVLTDCRWIGAKLARAQLALANGGDQEKVARELYEGSTLTLGKSREAVERLKVVAFTELLDRRTRTGSAENPVTKLFPAAVTERQFLDELERLCDSRKSVEYRDERFAGHTLVDFRIHEDDVELPVNVKNAGTRFESSMSLVGLAPDDCIPIPAYKAHDAVEKEPNLVYAISVNYTLIRKIESNLIPLLDKDEAEVWRLLNQFSGSLIREAEDRFIYAAVNKYWDEFSGHVTLPVFRLVSSRKAIRVLQTLPKRTPGIGLRAWGTGASAEVNVHLSIGTETKAWDEIHRRIASAGVKDIVDAVNRKRTELVFDPEI